MIASADFPGYILESGCLRRATTEELYRLAQPQAAPSRSSSSRLAAVIVPVAIDATMPRAENVEAIRQAVAGIPERFLLAWSKKGGRLEILPSKNASAHPRFSAYGPAAGWQYRELSVVAGDRPDAPRNAIHEIGHGVDWALARLSRSTTWLAIWQADKAAGRVPAFANQRSEPEEYFAETFARLYGSAPVRPASLAGQRFIERLL